MWQYYCSIKWRESQKIENNKDTELLQRVKRRASEILNEYEKNQSIELDQNIVATALNSQKDIVNLNLLNYKNLN